MMEMNNEVMAEEPSAPTDSEEMQGTPMDEIISRVESYIQDPKLVTPQTMQELLSDLMEVKQIVDGEESPEEETSPVMDAIRSSKGA